MDSGLGVYEHNFVSESYRIHGPQITPNKSPTSATVNNLRSVLRTIAKRIWVKSTLDALGQLGLPKRFGVR